MERGRGNREILAAGEANKRVAFGEADDSEAARAALLSIAEQRGLPIVLPLVDGEDLARLGFSDLWGEFSEPVIEASARYGADAILIGRSRGPDPTTAQLRWTLLLGRERMDWTGTLADGPHGAADRLAARLAAAAGEQQWLRVEIGNVAMLRDYAQVYTLFTGLSLVEECQVVAVDDDRLRLALRVRGTADQLMRGLALRRLLDIDAAPPAPRSADLYYRLRNR